LRAACPFPLSAVAHVQLTPVVSGLTSPVFIANAGDNLHRLFIVGRLEGRQRGRLHSAAGPVGQSANDGNVAAHVVEEMGEKPADDQVSARLGEGYDLGPIERCRRARIESPVHPVDWIVDETREHARNRELDEAGVDTVHRRSRRVDQEQVHPGDEEVDGAAGLDLDVVGNDLVRVLPCACCRRLRSGPPPGPSATRQARYAKR